MTGLHLRVCIYEPENMWCHAFASTLHHLMDAISNIHLHSQVTISEQMDIALVARECVEFSF